MLSILYVALEMTVIAEIPYKDGVLTVADSRLTFSLNLPFMSDRMMHSDGHRKIFESKDGDMVVAAGGDVILSDKVVDYFLSHQAILEWYCKNADDETNIYIRKQLDGMLEELPEHMAALLVSVRLDDGRIKSFRVEVENEFGSPFTTFEEITSAAAYGSPETLDEYLEKLVEKHGNEGRERSLAEAMALGFLLEDRYIDEYRVVEKTGQRIKDVGGPIAMHATSKEPSKDVDLRIGNLERKRMEEKTYKELVAYFTDKIGETGVKKQKSKSF